MADVLELCRQIASDSKPAYVELWNEFRTEIRNLVAAKIGNEEVVTDIVQETLLAIWSNRQRLAAIERPRSWILRIARNKVADFYRRGSRKRELPLPHDELAELYATAPETGAEYDDADLSVLSQIFDRLPTPERTALFFHYVWHFSYRSIAEIYRVSPETLKKVMQEVRLFIRHHYLVRTGNNPDVHLPGGRIRRRLLVPELGMRYRNPTMDAVETISVEYAPGKWIDLFYPPDLSRRGAAPAIIISMGYPDEATTRYFGTPLKGHPLYVTWPQAMASAGFIAATYNTDKPESDIVSVKKYLADHAAALSIDPVCFGVWACSGCAEVALHLVNSEMRREGCALKFAVFYYPCFSHDAVMPVLPREKPPVPLLIVKAGKEMPTYAEEIERFITDYRQNNSVVAEMIHESGDHGFEMWNDDAMTRVIIGDTLTFMRNAVGAPEK